MDKRSYVVSDLYEQYKPLLFTLAYQLTGSVADAEDAVQDVFVKLYDVDSGRIASPKAYLCKMVTNRCLDFIKSARRRRELYFGMWLPEPLLTPAEDTSDRVVVEDLLSYALLVLLDRLSPSERAVFVLREALSLDYAAIAKIMGKSVANCRKLLSRAKLKLGQRGKDTPPTVVIGAEWLHQFLRVLMQDDVDALLPLLAEDVEARSDGGGQVLAAARPIKQRRQVARYLVGLMHKISPLEGEWRFELAPLNGQAGIIIWQKDAMDSVVLMDVVKGMVRTLYIIRNPEKLRYLKG